MDKENSARLATNCRSHQKKAVKHRQYFPDLQHRISRYNYPFCSSSDRLRIVGSFSIKRSQLKRLTAIQRQWLDKEHLSSWS